MHRFLLLLLATLCLGGCTEPKPAKKSGLSDSPDQFANTIDPIVESEKTILDLAPYIADIGNAMTKDSAVTKSSLRDIFAPEVLLTKIGESDSRPSTNFLDELWQPFLGQNKFIECQFGTESGVFKESGQRFDMKMFFEGKLRINGVLNGVTARQTVTWKRINKLWTITSWQQHSFDVISEAEPMFVDSTRKLIPDKNTFEATSTSSHEQRVLDAVSRKTVMEPLTEGLPGFNDWESAWQFPSASVVDYNNDGLLDLYLSTYVSPSGAAKPEKWIDELLPKSDRDNYRSLSSNHPFIDRGGPANILLVNVNGRLQRCENNDLLKQWRNSYQSAWHDWDNDGDQDLFVCNDFAPDAFLRNDTAKGQTVPIFVDVTSEMIDKDIMGYSMGASWGDVDNDGDMDLYVSEMYSKAGKRILSKFPEADKRSVVAAKGNFLFENEGDGFQQIAGNENGKLNVAKVGWSFGGQFADFDNDGWLDLYVPSGFYTAPEIVRSNADL